MTSLNNTISSIYNNLYTFFNYRNLVSLDSQLNDDEFIKHIYNNEYFLIHTVSGNITDNSELTEIKDNINNTKYKNTKNYKITYILLFHYATDIHSKSPEFKKILNILNKTPFLYNIIIITKSMLSTHVKNYIATINNKIFENITNLECSCNYSYCDCNKLKIFTYVYDRFTFIIPNHILSNKHRILNFEEETELLENLIITKSKFPIIRINDPLIIWSSGIVGNIVEITRNDDITGISLYYRVIRDI
jgi:DNA-directed RNA polymerase subunit H (RpoH/RPB5)